MYIVLKITRFSSSESLVKYENLLTIYKQYSPTIKTTNCTKIRLKERNKIDLIIRLLECSQIK